MPIRTKRSDFGWTFLRFSNGEAIFATLLHATDCWMCDFEIASSTPVHDFYVVLFRWYFTEFPVGGCSVSCRNALCLAVVVTPKQV